MAHVRCCIMVHVNPLELQGQFLTKKSRIVFSLSIELNLYSVFREIRLHEAINEFTFRAYKFNIGFLVACCSELTSKVSVLSALRFVCVRLSLNLLFS